MRDLPHNERAADHQHPSHDVSNHRSRFAKAVTIALLVTLVVAQTQPSAAQTWRWTYVSRTPHNPLPPAESSVAITADAVRLAYTVPTKTGRIVIESCRAELRDIADANAIESSGTKFLLVRFKPDHNAFCASGPRPAVALPADDVRQVTAVASAINRSCCQIVRVAVTDARVAATPAASATPAAAASPSPAPSATPVALALHDWVESDGLFRFVRLRNESTSTVTVRPRLTDCIDVTCSAPAAVRVAPGKIGTIASVAVTGGSGKAVFTYHYEASDGSQIVSGTGSAGKPPPRDVSRLTGPELRSAQAAALSALHPADTAAADDAAPADPLPGDAAPAGNAAFRPARLLARGSSRLAIGQTGTALVRVIVGANGTPQEATIVSISNANLAAAAIETAVSSTYAPAIRNGTPITAKYVATFAFDGEDPSLAGIPVWKRGQPAATPAAGNAVPSAAPSAGASAAPAEPSAAPLAPAASSAPLPTAPATSVSPMPAATAH